METVSSELVSVIIPVYNMQDYIIRCVDSALKQTHGNVQIILVDDGSTDNSGGICDAYQAKDNRVETIHRLNGGLSSARNAGLERVKGQWITFLDADDYISRRFIEHNLSACMEYGADISINKYIWDVRGDLNEDGFIQPSQYELITGREAAVRHFGKDAAFLNMACGKLSRAALWNDLRFPEGKINEDVFVSHRLLYGAKKIVLSDARLYAYFMSPGSIMRRPFTLKRLDALDAWEEGIRFFNSAGDRELYDIARRVYCNRLFDAHGICKKLLPDERSVHTRLRRRGIAAYGDIRRIYSYIDLSFTHFILYRGKQAVGRYFPFLYAALFLKNRSYI